MWLTRRSFGQGVGVALALTSSSALAHEGTHKVDVAIADFNFEPATIEILPGDSVTWTNSDITPHTATAEDGAWDTGALEQGEKAQLTFSDVGDFPYFCAFHSYMKGVIRVRPKDPA